MMLMVYLSMINYLKFLGLFFQVNLNSGEFNGEWNYTSSTDITNITLKVVLNTTRDLVKSFEYSYSSQSLDSEYYNEFYTSIFGFDIPLVEKNAEMIKFSISQQVMSVTTSLQ